MDYKFSVPKVLFHTAIEQIQNEPGEVKSFYESLQDDTSTGLRMIRLKESKSEELDSLISQRANSATYRRSCTHIVKHLQLFRRYVCEDSSYMIPKSDIIGVDNSIEYLLSNYSLWISDKEISECKQTSHSK